MEKEDQQRKRQERSRSEALSFSPSFNSYSSHHAADSAEKNSTNSDYDIEFSFVPSSDEIFGEIFPVFNRDLLMPTELTRRSVSLRKLFDDEDGKEGGNPAPNGIENVPVGTYSVWTPNIVGKKPGSRCKRSNSTKTWKPHYSLLRRSYSEGKESNSFWFSTPKKSRERNEGGEKEGKLFDDYKLPGFTSRLSLEKLLFTTGVADKGRSSAADELESVPTGTYSVWTPKVVEKSPSRCKKCKACFC